MNENVHKKFPIRKQPVANPVEQLFVIAHMLEHFDRHDAIKLTVSIEIIHITSDDFEVLQTGLAGMLQNEFPLGMGI